MKLPLPPLSAERVRLANTLLDSGRAADADEVLAKVDPCFRLQPDVLEARIAFNVCLRRLEEACELASVLERFYPERKGVIERQLARFPKAPEAKGSVWDTFRPI